MRKNGHVFSFNNIATVRHQNEKKVSRIFLNEHLRKKVRFTFQ